jgi:hypothetical protein
LPAEPIFTVRSRMPGKAISGLNTRPSKAICSHTSSQTATASWATQNSASRARSSSGKITAAGFTGLFSTTIFVFGVKAASSISRVMRQCGGSSRARRGTPPARRTIGV